MRTDDEREALVGRMRKAARKGMSMTEFAEAEGLTRSTVAGLKHRNGITFHGSRNREEYGERCRQAALKRWRREREQLSSPEHRS